MDNITKTYDEMLEEALKNDNGRKPDKDALLLDLVKKFICTMKIDIKYHKANMPKIEKIPMGDWIDLYCAEETFIGCGELGLIPLGVSMRLPHGFEAHLLPRSSTFGKYGIIMANGMGIIDESYCGNDDEWKFPAISLSREPYKMLTESGIDYVVGSTIPKGAKIAQFRIMPKMQNIIFNTVEMLDSTSRGGFGSTDKIK